MASKFQHGWVVICLAAVLCGQVSAQAQLKADTPRMDVPTAEPAPSARKVSPLQGKVERSGTAQRSLWGAARDGMLRGAGKARRDNSALKARVKDDRLTAAAQSGIGIIGVKFTLFAGRAPVINRVFPLTPAAQHGVQANDVIVAVDGVPTFGMSKEEVYDLIVGTPGTAVTVSLQRGNDYRAVTLMRMDLNDITDPFVRRDYMTNM